MMSRRQGLKALGAATAGAVLLGAGMSGAAHAAPRVPRVREQMTGYSITINNKSKLRDHNALIYQVDPGNHPDVVSLAWAAHGCDPNGSITFDWNLDYNFVWSADGELTPGTRFSAGEVISADLQKSNYVTLFYNEKTDTYHFGETSYLQGDSLYVFEDRSVPPVGEKGSGSVGIGMGGKPTYVKKTASNTTLSFEPTPQYWIAFGLLEEGEVMKQQELTAPQQVGFGKGKFHIEATYNGRDWIISDS